MQPAPRWPFTAVWFSLSLLHAFASGCVLLLLFSLTRGGGDSYPDSPAIEACGLALQALALPLAWALEKVWVPDARSLPLYLLFISVRLANSFLVGAFAAWVWDRRADA